MLQPAIYIPYLRLMRLHQPTGIWLLLWPCLWALTLAAPTLPHFSLYLLFILGAVIMRGAGCIINDIWDRDIDKQVERTRSRPLASGEISLEKALVFLLALLCAALFIMLQLPVAVWYLAVASLIPVAVYPAMKRITWWPQLFLGLAFNWGALMGWSAVTGKIEPAAITLYISGIFWTLGYDTIYAHQDKADDARIGVKSSALRLGRNNRAGVACFYSLCGFFMLATGLLSQQPFSFYAGSVLFCLHLAYQACKVDFENPSHCMAMFKSNALAGFLPLIGILLDKNL